MLRSTERIFFAGAILLLGYCGFVVTDAWVFQRYQKARLDVVFQPSAVHFTPAVIPDGLIGRIEISRLGISVVFVEGTADRALGRAAGHIVGTALPGQIGNVGIAAHGDTFFRPLKDVRPDDVITVTTFGGEYRYRTISTKVVSPTDVGVLSSDGNEVLTLVTCYPFYFVGPAPRRFVVRAEKIPSVTN